MALCREVWEEAMEALYQRCCLQALPKCDHHRHVTVRRGAVEETHNRQSRLLRARRIGHAAAAPPSVTTNSRRPMWIAMRRSRRVARQSEVTISPSSGNTNKRFALGNRNSCQLGVKTRIPPFWAYVSFFRQLRTLGCQCFRNLVP